MSKQSQVVLGVIWFVGYFVLHNVLHVITFENAVVSILATIGIILLIILDRLGEVNEDD